MAFASNFLAAFWASWWGWTLCCHRCSVCWWSGSFSRTSPTTLGSLGAQSARSTDETQLLSTLCTTSTTLTTARSSAASPTQCFFRWESHDLSIAMGEAEMNTMQWWCNITEAGEEQWGGGGNGQGGGEAVWGGGQLHQPHHHHYHHHHTHQISQSKDVSECTPRYIGHDIDSEMASNLRMLCLVVLLLRLVNLLGKVKWWQSVKYFGTKYLSKPKCRELSKKGVFWNLVEEMVWWSADAALPCFKVSFSRLPSSTPFTTGLLLLKLLVSDQHLGQPFY